MLGTEHDSYIRRCFELARKGLGNVSPNPLVGAVVVKDGKILGEGFHRAPGKDHAEKDALRDCSARGNNPSGATIYCNLEPCCHTDKRTPPCVPELIKAKIAKVVLSNIDPNLKVAGKGIKQLQAAGIEVITGVCEDQGEELNRVFFTNVREQRPYVHLKWAQSLDGNLALSNGVSQWITGSEARDYAQRWRAEYDALCVGGNTIRCDDPQLNYRIKGNINWAKSPRVLIRSRTSEEASFQSFRVFNDQRPSPVISGETPLKEWYSSLYQEGICSIYCEGGAQLLSEHMEMGQWDEASIFIAPIWLGNGRKVVTTDLTSIPEQQASIKKTLEIGKDHLIQLKRIR